MRWGGNTSHSWYDISGQFGGPQNTISESEKNWVRKGIPTHRLEPGTRCKVCRPTESKNTIITITLKAQWTNKNFNNLILIRLWELLHLIIWSTDHNRHPSTGFSIISSLHAIRGIQLVRPHLNINMHSNASTYFTFVVNEYSLNSIPKHC